MMNKKYLARAVAILLMVCMMAGLAGCKEQSAGPDEDSGAWAPLQREVNG